MACRWFFECLLKILNFLLTLAGLAMIGYGIYLLVRWKQESVNVNYVLPSTGNEAEVLRFGRPLLFVASLSTNILDKLPSAWFIYLFIAVGVIICIISCSGCIATITRRGCCLCCYTVLLVLLILAELGIAAFIFFDHKWEEVIPTDKTGDFNKIKEFLEKHLNIVKWVALGAVILQAIAVLLALVIRAMTRGPQGEYDSDDEYIAPRSSMRQPLLNRQGTQVAAVSPAVSEQRASRNDAWSTRMREKYGLDTTEFTYNPTESSRFSQPAPQPIEEKGRCTIIGCKYPSIAEEIREVASKDPAHRKLFVRGLAWETTSETLCDAFRKHGEIEEGAVIIDKATGKSRGFGFVTFKHMDSAQRALKEPSKNVDGRITICNLASEGGSSPAASNDQAQRKLYIGGLPLEVTSETLLNVFSKYGEIEEGSVAYEKNTNKSRGFAFITFRTADAAKKAIDDPNKTLEGRHIIVKLAGEGQKNRFVPHTASVSSSIPVASTPLAYGTVNPNVGRTRVAGTAAAPLGYSAYTPGFPAYPSSYPGLTTAAQYGASSQYNATNAQYTAFPPQQGQLSLPAGSIPGGGVFSYYTGGT